MDQFKQKFSTWMSPRSGKHLAPTSGADEKSADEEPKRRLGRSRSPKPRSPPFEKVLNNIMINHIPSKCYLYKTPNIDNDNNVTTTNDIDEKQNTQFNFDSKWNIAFKLNTTDSNDKSKSSNPPIESNETVSVALMTDGVNAPPRQDVDINDLQTKSDMNENNNNNNNNNNDGNNASFSKADIATLLVKGVEWFQAYQEAMERIKCLESENDGLKKLLNDVNKVNGSDTSDNLKIPGGNITASASTPSINLSPSNSDTNILPNHNSSKPSISKPILSERSRYGISGVDDLLIGIMPESLSDQEMGYTSDNPYEKIKLLDKISQKNKKKSKKSKKSHRRVSTVTSTPKTPNISDSNNGFKPKLDNRTNSVETGIGRYSNDNNNGRDKSESKQGNSLALCKDSINIANKIDEFCNILPKFGMLGVEFDRIKNNQHRKLFDEMLIKWEDEYESKKENKMKSDEKDNTENDAGDNDNDDVDDVGLKMLNILSGGSSDKIDNKGNENNNNDKDSDSDIDSDDIDDELFEKAENETKKQIYDFLFKIMVICYDRMFYYKQQYDDQIDTQGKFKYLDQLLNVAKYVAKSRDMNQIDEKSADDSVTFGKAVMETIEAEAIDYIGQQSYEEFKITKELLYDGKGIENAFYEYIGECCKISAYLVLWNSLLKYKTRRRSIRSNNSNEDIFSISIMLYPSTFDRTEEYNYKYHKLESGSEIINNINKQQQYITYFTFPGLRKDIKIDRQNKRPWVVSACVFIGEDEEF